MYGKVTYLESRAIEVYFGFVQHIRTQRWFSHTEIDKAKYRGKPSDGDRRTVTIWQGSKNNYHQKLEIHFVYVEEFGGWNLNGVIFSGSTPDAEDQSYEWSQAFRGGERYGQENLWKFVPVKFDGRYFVDYNLRDASENEEFELACKRQFPRTKQAS